MTEPDEPPITRDEMEEALKVGICVVGTRVVKCLERHGGTPQFIYTVLLVETLTGETRYIWRTWPDLPNEVIIPSAAN